MRKLVSFFLIWLFLFNIIGYYGVYAGLIHQARSKADREIENNTYDKTQTITIKIPISLPYPVQSGVERVSGDFEYQGQFYELVEQKYEQDTVHVICLKNHDKVKAKEALDNFVKQSTDPLPSTHQSTKTVAGLIKDFNPTMEKITLTPPNAILLETTFAWSDVNFPAPCFPVLTPPPNSIG